MSDLLNLRVITTPAAVARAIDRLAELLDLDRQDGPYPSRKTSGVVRFYLAGRLRPPANTPALAGEVERLERQAGRLRAALELLTFCEHGQGLDCPDCEPIPDLVRQALEGEAVRPA